MDMKTKIVSGCYLINAIYFLIVGLVFIFATELLPFHIDVIQTSWDELDGLSQTLFLGMMRTEGTGFLASAAAILILFIIPYRRKRFWAVPAMSFIGIVEHLPTLIANFHVSQTTSATPPWPMALIGISLFILGFALSIQKLKMS